MENKETIRQNVRQAYGTVATQGRYDKDGAALRSCCSVPDGNEKKINLSGCGCGSKEFSPEEISAFLGYSKEDLEAAPEGANLGLGCGSPKTIAEIKKGETIVDLGSGGGFDCFLAARETGATGRVIGVDMTPEMISRARMNKEKAGAGNVEFRLGEIEHLPVEDNFADLIISNCVINLSPEKPQVFKDAFRVLKPGGRIAVSDIVALKPLPEDIKNDLAMISACIGGAATIEDTQMMLTKAGFEKIEITTQKIGQEFVEAFLPGSLAGEYVVSGYIQARKPVAHS